MERLETINKRLESYFGKDDRNLPIWRVVWSDDQIEKQLLSYTPEGLSLLRPEWREVPKYKMMGIHSRYILERLVVVPPVHEGEMIAKTSYEPMWTFEDSLGNPLPPKWEACEIIVNTVYAAQGKKTSEALYHDEESGLATPELLEYHKERIANVTEELFGNETDTGDALAYREGISVPSNYNSNKGKVQ